MLKMETVNVKKDIMKFILNALNANIPVNYVKININVINALIWTIWYLKMINVYVRMVIFLINPFVKVKFIVK